VESTIEAVARAPISNIEAADVTAAEWNEAARAAVEEFEPANISFTLGWSFRETGR
jgi:hypothetical protein